MNRVSKLLFFTIFAACSISSCSKKLWNNTNSSKSERGLLINGENAYDETAERWAKVKSTSSPVRGWEYVIDKLAKAGVDTKTLAEIYSDPKIPTWTPISFKVKPKESKQSYKEHINEAAIKNAISFYKENINYFKNAEKKFGVTQSIILSILQVETKCGKNTGNEPIIYWLSRLVSTGFPPNLTYNLSESKEVPPPTLKEFEERASWLEEEFLPHLISTIQISKKAGTSPFDIVGSKGGAIGMPQFLPGNVEKFGIDGDKNGSVNIYTAADAISSVANFLKLHGWRSGQTEQQKHNVILEYNRSTAYAETVLSMSKRLEKKM